MYVIKMTLVRQIICFPSTISRNLECKSEIDPSRRLDTFATRLGIIDRPQAM